MNRNRETRSALGNTAMLFAVTLPMLLIAAGSTAIYLYEAQSMVLADVRK